MVLARGRAAEGCMLLDPTDTDQRSTKPGTESKEALRFDLGY